MKSQKLLYLVFVTLPFFNTNLSQAEENQGDSLTPSKEIIAAISHLNHEVPIASLKRSDFIRSLGDDKGMPTIEEYLALQPNIWAIRSISELKKGASQATAISLCGIIELVASASASVSVDHLISIPIGQTFSTFGITNNLTNTSTSRTTNLSFDEGGKNICTPAPGDTFAYEYRVESESNVKSMLSISNKRTNSFKMNCIVGNPIPIDKIVSEKSGNYLPVKCSGTNTNTNQQLVTDYIFVQSAGLYINTTRETNGFRLSAKLISLTYK